MAIPRVFDAHILVDEERDKEWLEPFMEGQLNLLRDFAVRLFRESDRGCLLLAQSTMDVRLKELLGIVFDSQVDPGQPLSSEDRKNLFSSVTAPLQSFSNCVKVCRALGVISVYECKLLNQFNKMRVPGAHSAEDVGIAEKDLVKLVSDLGVGWIMRVGFLIGISKGVYEAVHRHKGEDAAREVLQAWGFSENPFENQKRLEFVVAAAILLFLLNIRIELLKHRMCDVSAS